MDTENFWKGMDKLTHWYKHKDMDKVFDSETQDMWLRKISFIPNLIFQEIVDQVTDTSRFMPTPDEIKRLYMDYRRIHPEKFMKYEQEKEHCDYCEGHGHIEAWRMWGAYSYAYLIPCGHCNNWKRFFPENETPRTIHEIEGAGFSLHDPEKGDVEIKKKYGTVEEMVDDTCARIPEQDVIPF